MRTISLYKIIVFLALISGLFISFITPGTADAQSLELTNSAGIRITPEFPEPGAKVEASIDAYSLDTTGARITWNLDGVLIPGTDDARSVEVFAGKLGEKKLLSARIEPVQGAPFTLRRYITPTAVDIVVEASTYVPSFYRGRALPSADSEVRVIAIPQLGDNTSPKTLTYQWEQNGNILFGGPVRGKQSITVSTPRYIGGYLSVSIFDGEGNRVARRDISLTAVPPELHFYEENPLRGLSELAIRNNLSLIGDETTVHGEPYFFNMKGGETYSWEINGAPGSATIDPHIITLRKTGGGGTANIGLEVMNDLGIPEFLRGGFSINF